ncbi:hypothetical protein DL771_006264 [Monosporascus sp. 5C6A]|nr:hypothetical protein DL771_006264 [Monosporascus sp. 5C6A]
MSQSKQGGRNHMKLPSRNVVAWAIVGALHCWVIFLLTNSTSLYTSLGPKPPLDSSTVTATSTTSSSPFLEALKTRRTYYALNKSLPVSSDQITKIVEEAIQAIPSGFNSQTNRAVVLFGAEHDKLWDIATDVLQARVSKDQWESTREKMAGFKAAAGTILLYTDEAIVNSFATNIPSYASEFPIWAGQSEGMLQLAVWTALELEGLGANLQHYNPLIDARIAEEWQVPGSWRLRAQLIFGGRADVPREKSFRPVEEKLKVFSA